MRSLRGADPAQAPCGARALEAVAEVQRSLRSAACPPAVPGFVGSDFPPLLVEAAGECLTAAARSCPGRETLFERTGIVLASASGDLQTSERVAELIAAQGRISPLLLLQACPNSVLGWIAKRWGLRGPLACICPVDDALSEARAVAELWRLDGATEASLLLLIEMERRGADCDGAVRAIFLTAGQEEPEPRWD